MSEKSHIREKAKWGKNETRGTRGRFGAILRRKEKIFIPISSYINV